jgi:hypothetical protein
VAGSRVRKRRPRRTAWLVGPGLVALCALSFGVTFVVANQDGDDASDGDAATPSSTGVATETEATRLTSESRLGYDGVGPIKLGMTIADAERAGQVATANTGCGLTFDPTSDTGLRYGDVHIADDGRGAIVGLDIDTAAIRTISGIHIGSTREDVHRTYANAVDLGPSTIRITNPEGRRITFVLDRDGVVISISLHEPGPSSAIDPRC